MYIVVLVVFVAFFIYHGYRWLTQQKPIAITTVPGLEPSSPITGNRDEMKSAGSLNQFLTDLHRKFGDIASFWYDKTFFVSIASPKLFREQQHVFDRPAHLYKDFEPAFGPRCLQFANGDDARTRRRHYDRAFVHGMLPKYLPPFLKVCDDVVRQWMTYGHDDVVNVSDDASHYAVKCALWNLMGDKFQNDQDVKEFKDKFNTAFSKLERAVCDSVPLHEGSPQRTTIDEELKKFRDVVKEAVRHRKERSVSKQGNRLLDTIMEVNADDDILLEDAIVFVLGGFHTTANALAWGFHYLANNSDVQERVYDEIAEVLGEDKGIDEENINSFKYVTQVIDETMRCCVLSTYSSRVQDRAIQLGGHTIPANTPVVQAFGIVFHDEKLWPEPKKFDPDRFSDENRKRHGTYSFTPFGFAGGRKCPGYKFAYWEMTVFIVSLIRRFRITSGNEGVLEPVYGIVTHPSEDVWVKLTHRK